MPAAPGREEVGHGDLVEAGAVAGKRGQGRTADEYRAGQVVPARALVEGPERPVAGEQADVCV